MQVKASSKDVLFSLDWAVCVQFIPAILICRLPTSRGVSLSYGVREVPANLLLISSIFGLVDTLCRVCLVSCVFGLVDTWPAHFHFSVSAVTSTFSSLLLSFLFS